MHGCVQTCILCLSLGNLTNQKTPHNCSHLLSQLRPVVSLFKTSCSLVSSKMSSKLASIQILNDLLSQRSPRNTKPIFLKKKTLRNMMFCAGCFVGHFYQVSLKSSPFSYNSFKKSKPMISLYKETNNETLLLNITGTLLSILNLCRITRLNFSK